MNSRNKPRESEITFPCLLLRKDSTNSIGLAGKKRGKEKWHPSFGKLPQQHYGCSWLWQLRTWALGVVCTTTYKTQVGWAFGLIIFWWRYMLQTSGEREWGGNVVQNHKQYWDEGRSIELHSRTPMLLVEFYLYWTMCHFPTGKNKEWDELKVSFPPTTLLS